LIILNAITTEGPLCETDDNGRPIDDLKWKGDTCHPTDRGDGKLTCETLWIAQSHTGDYHDNMNSEMFMQWVEDKLVPVFERKYPGKKMVLLADNVPYHHKRVIGSPASLSKKKIVEMMVEHEVETIDLPINEKRMELLDTNDYEMEDRGNCIRIPFCPDEQLLRAGVGHPRVANVDELKVAFVEYLRDNKPAMLECAVEKYLQDRGHKVLWTPPYCPDLQSIELY
jgi:hypothetical protein